MSSKGATAAKLDQNVKPVVSEDKKYTKYKWDEISKHKTENSRWLVINGKVYDVSEWQHTHPGGKQLLVENAANDVTIVFHETGHSSNAIKILDKLQIGIVDT